MTHYKKYDDKQRNDPVLRKAVEAELAAFNKHLLAAKELLEKAYRELQTAGNIEEDNLDASSGIQEARIAILTAIRRFDFKIESRPTPTYVGNVAAAMSADKAEELKAKYIEENEV